MLARKSEIVMNRSGTVTIAFLRVLPQTRNLTRLFGAVVSVLLLLLAAAVGGAAQAYPSESGVADLLGPHSDGARGCAVCHASRSAAASSEQGEGTASVAIYLWGASGSPDYGTAVPLADDTRSIEVRPAALSGRRQDVTGVLLCLSCHDGNLTPHNMMQSWSYEHEIGLLDLTPYRNQKIPSLLGRDEESKNDHPIGPGAPINPGRGLVFLNGKFSVMPNSPYAQFIANYGWPSLAPGKHSSAYGVSNSGEPYALCTTCHDQHVRNVYVSGGSSPIAGDESGKFYTTYFFVNGPYNPAQDKLADQAGLNRVHLYRLENGKQSMTLRTLKLIADALDVSMAELVKRL